MISCAAAAASCCACAGVMPGFSRPTSVIAPSSRALDQFRLGEAHRHPKLAAVQLAGNQGKLEFTRHHADDFVRLAVEKNFLAEDVGIAMESASPGLIAEHRHLPLPSSSCWVKARPINGETSKHGKHAGSKPRGIDLCRFTQAGEFIGRWLIAAQARKRMSVAHIGANSQAR